MLLVEEAQARILEGAAPLGDEVVSLEQAHGRVLAEVIHAPEDVPSFDNSAMDGFAVRWAEVQAVAQGQEVALPVLVEAPAGAAPSTLPPGGVARIMTGGPLPQGADTVVMREDTRMQGEQVVISALPGKGQGAHIRRRGEVLARGQEVLRPGVALRAGELGLLATFGRAHVQVRRRPRVALVATGDELVELGQVPGPGQIVASSRPMLAALVEAAGGQVLRLPIARDTVEDTARVFSQALQVADVVLSTGGVSVGDHDVVRDVMVDLCQGLGFWKVRMKPGKPLAFGRTQSGVALLGLPGNPVSTYVSFWLFVWPLLRRLQGIAPEALEVVEARLELGLRSTPKRLEMVRGVLRWTARGWSFVPFGGQGSADMTSLLGVNALARIPVGCAGLEAGQAVQVERLPV